MYSVLSCPVPFSLSFPLMRSGIFERGLPSMWRTRMTKPACYPSCVSTRNDPFSSLLPGPQGPLLSYLQYCPTTTSPFLALTLRP